MVPYQNSTKVAFFFPFFYFFYFLFRKINKWQIIAKNKKPAHLVLVGNCNFIQNLERIYCQ